MKLKVLALGIALAFPMGIMAQSDYGNHDQNLMQSLAQDAQAIAGQANYDQGAQHFLEREAQEAHSEMDLAHLALRKSDNSQVRQYAQNVLDNMPHIVRRAEHISQNNGGQNNAQPTDREQNVYQRLSNVSGRQFDEAYMGYEAHRDRADLHMLDRAENNSNDPQVRDFAGHEENTIRNADQQAEMIESNFNGNGNGWTNGYNNGLNH